MADQCTLTRAANLSVELVGLTIVARASGIEVSTGRRCDIQLVTEGRETVLRLVTCPGEGDSDSIVRSFALAAAPERVIVLHLDGESVFPFQVAATSGDGGALRGGDARRMPSEPMARRTIPAPDAPPPPKPMAPPIPAPMSAPPEPMAEAAPPPMSAPGPSIRLPRISFDWLRRLPGGSGTRGLDAGDRRGAPDDSEETAAAAEQPAAGDRPSLHAAIEAPDRFVVGKAEDVTIGLGPSPNPQLFTAPFTVPDSVGDRYILSVQLLADGFHRADGKDEWLFDLAVTTQQPYPTETVSLEADPIEGELKLRRLSVVYAIDGQPVGVAERPVAVVAKSETPAARPEQPGYAARQAMVIPVSDRPADLTVVILHDPEGERGRLLWALSSPHPGVPLPVHDMSSDIGETPQDFANALRVQIETAESTPGQPFLREILLDIGSRIANEFPKEFWNVFTAVQQAVKDRVPSVLLLSQEPYVPWELALVSPPLDETVPPFLGAQAVVGRWVFGQDKPKMPPPEKVGMTRMAVVYGEYAGNAELKEALAEKAELESSLGALPVRATLPAMQELLHGQPPGEVLHFAIHGRFATGSTGGLLMEDGASLGTFAVGGSNLAAAPFVFLNACQVGAGTQLLGDYAGMAEAFLRAGASAVIAPLWSVRDGPAKDIALRFYAEALGGGVPADILRQVRASFGTSGNPQTATHLAYLFYGHPSFRLTRP